MTKSDIAFEESLSDTWDNEGKEVYEVPLHDRQLYQVGFAVFLVGIIVTGQLFYLNVFRRGFYAPRAAANIGYAETVPAARGIVTDRYGAVLAENRAVFTALLDIRQFLKQSELTQSTLAAIFRTLAIPPEEVWSIIHERDLERSLDPIVLARGISQSQAVAVRDTKLPTFRVENTFERSYPERAAFSSLLGYVGLATKEDLANNSDMSSRETVGKSGLERQYDDVLRGGAGIHLTLRDAEGNYLGEEDQKLPVSGPALKTTIDGDLQKYFYNRFAQALLELGRTSGGGLAINPQTGEILSIFSFPSYDPNIFVVSGRGVERAALLSDPSRPLFDRMVSGEYNPGSTIKPLMGVAALSEGVITPDYSVFSPGYLDVPNPYDPSNPSRFLDWRYQGYINLYSAIAQSSNVYFYTIGGGANEVRGLGLDRLYSWWQKFGLGTKTGIDLPQEGDGFLPTAEWKEKTFGRPWFLGDTYNVSIGQGDLSVTPLQLISYIGAIANGGKIFAPHVGSTVQEKVNADLTSFLPEIKEVRQGMRATVTSALGTAHTLENLPFPVSAKTGSAQVKNNTEENAFFVGYAPSDNPQIAILVLVENSKAGSLNAVPIAEDVLAWYYEHRLKQ